MNNNKELDQIVNFFKKDQLDEALELCNKNNNKQIVKLYGDKEITKYFLLKLAVLSIFKI